MTKGKKQGAAPAAAKAAVGATVLAATGEELPDVTLDDLIGRVGAADESVRAALFTHVDAADLIAMGVKIDSANILLEGPKLVAKALATWTALDESGRGHVMADVDAFAALAVSELVILREKNDALIHVSTAGSQSRTRLRSSLKEAMRAGIALRDDAYGSLRKAVGSHAVLLPLVDDAVGTAETPAALVKGLTGLAKLIRTEVPSTLGSGAAKLLSVLRLNDALATRLDEAAAKVKSAADATSSSQPSVDVLQRDLDLQDGRTLYILDLIVRALRSAQERDARIVAPRPRLLTGLVGPRAPSSKSKPKQDPSNPPSPAK